MDCRVFEKRLEDLIEDNISYDLKDAMLKHMKKCESCRALYEEEISIQKTFREALSLEPQSFRSLRGDIMKNIDKNRYGKNPMKKLLYHIKKYRITYTTAAAFIMVAVFSTSYAVKNNFIGSAKKSLSSDTQNMQAASLEKNKTAEDSIFKAEENSDEGQEVTGAQKNGDNNDASKDQPDTKSAEVKSDAYMPRFEKKELDKGTKVEFNTPWEISPSRKYSAAVEGKGDAAQEEGIANIVLKDLKTGKLWSFNLLDNEEKQFTPKAVKWINDTKLLVIVGYGYGTIDLGGKLYILDVDTGTIMDADPNNTAKLDEKSQITNILKVNFSETKPLEIDVEVLVYEDDAFNESHTENRTIKSYSPPFN